MQEEDKYLWLEEVTGDKALQWAKEKSDHALDLLGSGEQNALRERLLSIYNSQDKLPYVFKRGAHLYNFWQDAQHTRGLWRRTSLDEYKKKEPRWEVLVDLDALAASEHENWVFGGVVWLEPKYTRALVKLSRGGGDAVVVREYDVVAKSFVKNGFELPEAKSFVAWKDVDHVYVGTDFGPGSLTSSGYPRIAKLWQRGTPLTAATTLYEGQDSDVGVSAVRDVHQGRTIDLIGRNLSFFEDEVYIPEGDKPQQLDKPKDAEVSFFQDFLLLQLRSDWNEGGKTWPAGSLLAAPLAAYRAGKRELQAVYTPAPNRSLASYDGTKNALLLNILEDVHTKVQVARFAQGKWATEDLPDIGLGTVNTAAYDSEHDDAYWFNSSSFVAPDQVFLGDLGKNTRQLLRSGPAFFASDKLEVTQHFATSKDGTRIPYYQVSQRGIALAGDNPTLLTAYGGFEVSLTPGYNPTVGAAWLERGGVFVQANIRGGGEYGPAWHEAARKQHRQRAFDDFIAVAEDLIARKVTQPKRLGIMGGSNGGLLMGAMFTQRPELWGAVVCSVPLLDMKRYHHLLAGASWIGEYGDPDKPEEWAAISEYSPYQKVRAGVAYPRIFFTTSTRDDRVHPGHARKMVARMLEQGHDVLYFENMEGGHAGAANNEQRAHVMSISYAYLAAQLMR
jgi:prolyl oligopeptidase